MGGRARSDQSKALYRRRPDRWRGLPRQGRHPARDRRFRPQSGFPCRAGLCLYFCLHPRSRNTAPRRNIRPRCAPHDAGQRVGDRRTRRTPRKRNRGRRWPCRAGRAAGPRRLAGQNSRGFAHRLREPARRACPCGDDGCGAWPRLARYLVARGHWPRAGRRF